MKTTKKYLKSKAETPLQRNVASWVNNEAGDYNGDIKQVFDDLLNHGCVSGMVGHLIYYTDTVAFYKKHRKEINSILADMLESMGLNSPAELFGDKWEKDDPLCQDDLNQNLLAWFGFEETAHILCNRVGIEI